MSWAFDNAGMLWHLTGQNAYLALVPVLIGLVIALPLGIASARWGWLYGCEGERLVTSSWSAADGAKELTSRETSGFC